MSSSGQVTVNEEERLAALRKYDVVDSRAETGYDDIAQLAAYICGTPVSLISFVDQDRQWFKARVGTDVNETPRDVSFCAHTIPTGTTLIVPDAQLDERFSSNPLVTGGPMVRFYAGAPIVEKGGNVLGTVCVLDTEPRLLTEKQISALEALARQVVVLLEQRMTITSLESAAQEASVSGKRIEDSERRLRLFVDSLPELAWMADADGYITWYNRRWYQYTGTTPQQMEGWGWQSVHDPEVLPSVMEKWTASIRTREPFEMVFPLRGADGVFRPFLTRIEPLRNGEGTVEWFGTNVEVDALLKTRLALEKSEEGLTQVLTATTDAVVSVNRQWIVTYMNPKAEELYGNAARLVGRNFEETFPDGATQNSPYREHFSRTMNEGIVTSFEAEYVDPLNFLLGVEVYPTKDGIVTFSRDITKLKNAAAAVLQSEKLAAVGRLASSIAHEINNPLEAVTNLLYLARTSQNLVEAQPYLTSADLELRRASVITNQTLRFHRQSTRPTLASFAELIQGIYTGQHSRLSNSRVEVKERDRAQHPVLCLEGEIRQVITNLIGNAIDAIHGRGGVLYVRGRDGKNWKTGESGMVITVADTGTGIALASQAKIFDAFYTTKGIGGTGLGLWISQEIVGRHHGTMRFRTSERTAHSGTVFTLFLPRDGARGMAGSEDAPRTVEPRSEEPL